MPDDSDKNQFYLYQFSKGRLNIEVGDVIEMDDEHWEVMLAHRIALDDAYTIADEGEPYLNVVEVIIQDYDTLEGRDQKYVVVRVGYSEVLKDFNKE